MIMFVCAWNFRACLVHFFLSLNFHHSSLIILNTKVVWYHHSVSITHYFSHYLGAPRLSWCSFFFSFFQVPSNPNPVKKKKKKPVKTEPSEEERKKKNNLVKKIEPVRKKKKKKVSWSKGVAEWVSHVCLITKMTLNYEL